MRTKGKKVGLALGSGGLRGLAHLGVLKVLTTEGVPINFLAGSSAGAIVAAYFATHGEIEKLEELILGMRKIDFVRLLDLAAPRKGLIRGKKIEKFLNQLFEGKSFSQLKIPLSISTADLRTGREICLTRGRVAEAVLASMTLPGALPPVSWGRSLLVDGGVVNPTPVDVVKKMGADLVIGVNLTMSGKVYLNDPNILETLLRSFEVLRTRTTKLAASRVGKNLVIIKPKMGKRQSLLVQFNEREKTIKKGERAAKKSLLTIKRLLG